MVTTPNTVRIAEPALTESSIMESATRPIRPRTAPRLVQPAAATSRQDQLAAAIPAPFNPYVLPADRTAAGWLRWGVQALVLSVVATIIWDRGVSIRPETKGQPVTAAPAQWVSALVLGAGLLAAAAALGLPWGVLPVAASAVVLTRRALAAIGEGLTFDEAMDRGVGKVILAGAGVGIWWGSVALADWVQSLTSSVASNPVTRIAAGEEAAADIQAQTSVAADSIAGAGTVAGTALVLIAAIWWGVSTWQHAAKKSDTTEAVTAEEATNV